MEFFFKYNYIALTVILLIFVGCNPEELPMTHQYITLSIGVVTGANAIQLTQLRERLDMIEKTINSQRFYNAEPEVYKHIQESGSDTLDFNFVRIEHRDIGGTFNWQTQIITINSRFFANRHIALDIGTISHEYMHKLGYTHDGWADRSSVPYRIGGLIRDYYR